MRARVSCPVMLVALVVLALRPPDIAVAQCNGNLFLEPVNLPSNVVRFSRRLQVAANTSDQSFKIVFDNLRLVPYPPGSPVPYVLFGTLFSARLAHSATCTTWPPIGSWRQGEAMLSPNIQDYPNSGNPLGTGRVGAKSSTPAVLVPQTILVDGITGHWLRGADLQLNLNGMETTIDVERRGTSTDTTAWQCNGTLPPDTYRQWDMTTTVKAPGCDVVLSQTTASFLAPDAYARYLGPFEFSTEFFTSSPGVFKVYLDDLQVQTEGDPSWKKLCTWRLGLQCGGTTEYGVKLSTDGSGRDVIEISNDGPANGGTGGFYPVGTTFSIPNCG